MEGFYVRKQKWLIVADSIVNFEGVNANWIGFSYNPNKCNVVLRY